MERRDFWIKSYTVLKIIDTIGFSGYFDHSTEIEDSDLFSTKTRMELDEMLGAEHFSKMVALFGWTNDRSKYKFRTMEKQSLITVLQRLLKTLGRRLDKRRLRRQRKNVYSLESIVLIEEEEMSEDSDDDDDDDDDDDFVIEDNDDD